MGGLFSAQESTQEELISAYKEGFALGQARQALGNDAIDDSIHQGYLSTAESHGPAADPVAVQRAIGYRDGYKSGLPASAKKKKGITRTKLLTIRLNERELQDFHRLARRSGLSASSYIRQIIYTELNKPNSPMGV